MKNILQEGFLESQKKVAEVIERVQHEFRTLLKSIDDFTDEFNKERSEGIENFSKDPVFIELKAREDISEYFTSEGIHPKLIDLLRKTKSLVHNNKKEFTIELDEAVLLSHLHAVDFQDDLNTILRFFGGPENYVFDEESLKITLTDSGRVFLYDTVAVLPNRLLVIKDDLRLGRSFYTNYRDLIFADTFVNTLLDLYKTHEIV